MADITSKIRNRVVVTTKRYTEYFDDTKVRYVLVEGVLTEERLKNILGTMSVTSQKTQAKEKGIVAFGAGIAMEYGKAISEKLECDLELIPGVFTSDAPWTDSYAIRNFETKEINYIPVKKFKTVILPGMLASIHKDSGDESPNKWCIAELCCHFVAEWEAMHIHGMNKLKSIERIAELLQQLPECGTEEWFMRVTDLFKLSIMIQNDYGVIYQEGSEHYMSYFDEMANDTIANHGQFLTAGIDMSMNSQAHNMYRQLWEQTKKKYDLYYSYSWFGTGQDITKELVEFLETNGFTKNMVMDMISNHRRNENES